MATLGLAMICKNEAAGIEASLASIKPHISRWTVLDTGSDDGTQGIVRRALDGVPGQLIEEPFVTFGVSRSRAFELARGTADYLLASDADMTWQIEAGWEPEAPTDALMVQMGSADFAYRLPLVLDGTLLWKSVGACHEYTARADGVPYTSQPTDKVRVSYPHDRSSAEKSRWHATLLEADLLENPDNARTIFYLAQTYADLGDERALDFYARRAEMGGWPEETFYAKYKAAALQPNWPDRLAALLAAWEFRPTRLEPLHAAIRELNSLGQHHAAYALIDGVSVESTSDVLFVHSSVWRYGMAFERAIAAWWVGNREECRILTEQVLALPDLPPDIRSAAEANLALC